ncbi:MAG: hypothetical protein ACKN9F_08230 [Methylomonas sp.]
MATNKKAAPDRHRVTAHVFTLKFASTPLAQRLKTAVFCIAPWLYLFGGGHG